MINHTLSRANKYSNASALPHSEFLTQGPHLSSPNQILITERGVVINAMDIDRHWNCCTLLVMVTSLNGEELNRCKPSSLHVKAGSGNHGPVLCNKTTHLAADQPKLSFSKLLYYIAVKEEKHELGLVQ